MSRGLPGEFWAGEGEGRGAVGWKKARKNPWQGLAKKAEGLYLWGQTKKYRL